MKFYSENNKNLSYINFWAIPKIIILLWKFYQGIKVNTSRFCFIVWDNLQQSSNF